jgi:hypothetical protein
VGKKCPIPLAIWLQGGGEESQGKVIGAGTSEVKSREAPHLAHLSAASTRPAREMGNSFPTSRGVERFPVEMTRIGRDNFAYGLPNVQIRFPRLAWPVECQARERPGNPSGILASKRAPRGLGMRGDLVKLSISPNSPIFPNFPSFPQPPLVTLIAWDGRGWRSGDKKGTFQPRHDNGQSIK